MSETPATGTEPTECRVIHPCPGDHLIPDYIRSLSATDAHGQRHFADDGVRISRRDRRAKSFGKKGKTDAS